MMNRTILMLLVAVFCRKAALSQAALDTGGGKIEAGNFVVEYSLGEVATLQVGALGGGNWFAAGVIQPMFVTSGANDDFDARYSFRAFPNPLADELRIETNFTGFQSFRVVNTLGQVLRTDVFRYAPIDLSELPAGVFYLSLQSANPSFFKTVKIVKQ